MRRDAVRRIHACSVLFAAFLSASLTQRDPISDYRVIVDAYRARENDAERLASQLPLDRIAALSARVTASDVERGWDAADLRAAAMLHTDVCVRLLKAGRPPEALVHLDAAIVFLDAALLRAAEYRDFARRWHVVASGFLHAYGSPARGDELRLRLPTALPETPSQQRARERFERGLDSEVLERLSSAAHDYEAALVADPAMFEAALHLGRIRLIDGRHPEAEKWLARASRSESVRVQYLAALLHGALAERTARFDAAEAQYRRALSAFKWGQSAPLALAQLLSRSNREADARQVLADHFARSRRRIVDPLWTYLVLPGDHLGQSLDELRAEVWR